MQKQTQISVWYFLVALLAVLWLRELWVESQQIEPLPYSEFQRLLKEGQIKEIKISDRMIQGTLSAPVQGRSRFVTIRVDPELARDLDKYPVKFTGVVESTFFRDVLSWVLPALAFFGIWYFLVRRFAQEQGLGGGFLSIGKSKAKVYVETDTKVTFVSVST